MKKEIVIPNNKYISIEQCKNYLNKNICKLFKLNNCTIQKKKSYCYIIQENNANFLQINSGSIIASGTNMDHQTLIGTYLITFTDYVRVNEEMKKIVKTK